MNLSNAFFFIAGVAAVEAFTGLISEGVCRYLYNRQKRRERDLSRAADFVETEYEGRHW